MSVVTISQSLQIKDMILTVERLEQTEQYTVIFGFPHPNVGIFERT